MQANQTPPGDVEHAGGPGEDPQQKRGERERLVHGYVREHLFMTPTEHADLVARLDAAARHAGLSLGKVFTEKLETVPQAFSALVQAVMDDDAAGIVVPNLHHLSVIGAPAAVRDELQRAVGAPVLVADSAP